MSRFSGNAGLSPDMMGQISVFGKEMAVIEHLDTNIIYENPKPHVRSRHGYFPGLSRLASGDLIALYVIAEAFESADATTYISRSIDEGRTWSLEGRLLDKSAIEIETSDYLKPTVLRDGSLVAIGYRFERADPECGIGIEETNGFLPGDNIIAFSADEGHSWSLPKVINRDCPELLEISGPCLELETGELIAVAGVLPLPDGTNPSGQFGATLFSSDQGQSWKAGARFFESPGNKIAAWEPRICGMGDGRLVVIFWAYDTSEGIHLPNHAASSHDNGRTWSPPINTGHTGQAANILWLGGERLLTIHCHRHGESAIYVRLIDFTDDRWHICSEQIIWGQAFNQVKGETGQTLNMFKSLSFGQPSLLRVGNGDFLATHWSIEDGQGKIRTHRLRVQM